MRLEIVHATSYRYSAPVFLEPHVLRFRPRSDSAQRLVSYEIAVAPRPTATSDTLDLYGDDSLLAWFDGTTDRLDVTARSVVDTLRPNPFDFIWLGPSTVPMEYPSELEAGLAPYRAHPPSVPVRDFALDVAAQAGNNLQQVLIALTNRVHEHCRQILRQEGDPLPPEETLARGEGACRDLALLQVALCRELGFAARFVSGYALSEAAPRDELHAWTEVFVPGGGWRGFDPTLGLAVSDHHVAVSAAPEPLGAAPIAGTFRGHAHALPIETDVTVRSRE